MARPGPQTQAKRQREQAKAEKRKDKEERRELRKKQKAENPGQADEIEQPDQQPSS